MKGYVVYLFFLEFFVMMRQGLYDKRIWYVEDVWSILCCCEAYPLYLGNHGWLFHLYETVERGSLHLCETVEEDGFECYTLSPTRGSTAQWRRERCFSLSLSSLFSIVLDLWLWLSCLNIFVWCDVEDTCSALLCSIFINIIFVVSSPHLCVCCACDDHMTCVLYKSRW